MFGFNSKSEDATVVGLRYDKNTAVVHLRVEVKEHNLINVLPQGVITFLQTYVFLIKGLL